MTPDEISAYLGRTLPAERRDALEQHLVACDDCRTDLITASKALDRDPRRWAVIVLPALAAAVLAVVFLVRPGGRVSVDFQAPPMRSEQGEGLRTFLAVSPEDGTEVAADGVRFEWRSEGPDARYRLTLTDGIGDVAWEKSTSDTVLALPPEVVVAPGARYFWRVDALLQGAESSTTGFRSFVIIAR